MVQEADELLRGKDGTVRRKLLYTLAHIMYFIYSADFRILFGLTHFIILYLLLYYQKGHWDSYAREEEEEIEKPCVAMFDPALRVLGRGSFGRVSFFLQ